MCHKYEFGYLYMVEQNFQLSENLDKLVYNSQRIRDVEAFWYKTEIKIIYFVQLCLILCDCMVYPDPKFFIFKTKKRTHFLPEVRGWFFILCYHARHLQQIYWSKLLCGMYGFTAKSSIATLNICQILMRFTIFVTELRFWEWADQVVMCDLASLSEVLPFINLFLDVYWR